MAMEQKPIDEAIEKIAKECEEANASSWIVVKIIKELNLLSEKELGTLRAKALEILRKEDPKAATIFASFQRMSVRTSSHEIEAFDRGNIIKSLLRETSIPRVLAEKIGREVEEKINELNIEYINTALIRELVNVKLLEYGHESVRNQYARVGLPVFEVEKKIFETPYANKAILTEFNLLKVIPKKLSDLHMDSDIFISELPDFSTKPVSIAVPVKGKKNFKKTVFDSVKNASYMQRFFSKGVNLAEANVAIAEQIEKKQVNEAAELFSNAVACGLGSKRTTIGLNLFVPDHVETDLNKEVLVILAKKILEKTKLQHVKSDLAFSIETKYQINLLDSKYCRGVDFLNCKKNYFHALNGLPGNNGICFMAGLNLVKQAAGKDKQGFEERILDRIEKIKALDELKKSQLKKRAYLQKAGIDSEKMQSVLGLFGLVSACRRCSQEPNKKSVFDYCGKTLDKIKSVLGENWIVSELYEPEAIKRFEAYNRRELKAESKSDDYKNLLRAGLEKKIFFRARAKNKPNFAELMDANAQWIRFKQ